MLNFGYKSLGELTIHKAQRNGAKTLLCFRDETLSYAEFNDLTNRVAHSFLAAGIKPRSRVGIVLWNTPWSLRPPQVGTRSLLRFTSLRLGRSGGGGRLAGAPVWR